MMAGGHTCFMIWIGGRRGAQVQIDGPPMIFTVNNNSCSQSYRSHDYEYVLPCAERVVMTMNIVPMMAVITDRECTLAQLSVFPVHHRSSPTERVVGHNYEYGSCGCHHRQGGYTGPIECISQCITEAPQQKGL